MKQIFFTLTVCLGICTSGYTQSYIDTYGISIMSGGDVYVNFPNGLPAEKGATLSPFLYEKFQTGSVFLNENNLKKVDKINFNILTNEVTAVKDGNTLYYDPQMIKGFVIDANGQRRLFIRAKPLNSNQLEFFEVLLNDRITVLLDRDYKLKRGTYNPALAVGEKDSYIVQQNLYLLKDDEPIILKRNKKAVLAQVAPYQKNIQALVKTHKLDYRKTDDLMEILREYNKFLSPKRTQ